VVIEPIIDSHNQKSGYRAICHNITDKKQVEVLAVTDPLTQLYNRHHIDDVLQYEINQSRRYKSALSLIILDIDLFKNINDTYGHNIGDKVLVNIAGELQANVRGSDTLGRWGGEEFIIIAPKTTSDYDYQ